MGAAPASRRRDVLRTGTGSAAGAVLPAVLRRAAAATALAVACTTTPPRRHWGLGQYLHVPDRSVQPQRARLDAAARRRGDRRCACVLGFPIAWLYQRGRRRGCRRMHHPDRAAAAADQRRGAHLRLDRHPGPPGHRQRDAAVAGHDRYAAAAALHPGRPGRGAGAGADAADDAAADHRARPASTPTSRTPPAALGAGSWRTFFGSRCRCRCRASSPAAC